MFVRRCPTLPQGPPCSTIGAASLSFRVRNVSGRFPRAMAAETLGPTCPHLGAGVGGFGGPLTVVGVVLNYVCFRLKGTTEWTRDILGHAHGLYLNEFKSCGCSDYQVIGLLVPVSSDSR